MINPQILENLNDETNCYVYDLGYLSTKRLDKISNYLDKYSQNENLVIKLEPVQIINNNLKLFFKKQENYVLLSEYIIKNQFKDLQEKLLFALNLISFVIEIKKAFSSNLFNLNPSRILYNEKSNNFNILFLNVEDYYINITHNFQKIKDNDDKKGIYMGPELSKNFYRNCSKMYLDIYSLGGIIYYILIGNELTENDKKTIFSQSNDSNNTFIQINTFDKRLIEIIQKCLNENPFERFNSFQEIKVDLFSYYMSKFEKLICSNTKCINSSIEYCCQCEKKYCKTCINDDGTCPKGHDVLITFNELNNILLDSMTRIKDRGQNFQNRKFEKNQNLNFLKDFRNDLEKILKSFLNTYDKLIENSKEIESKLEKMYIYKNNFDNEIEMEIKKVTLQEQVLNFDEVIEKEKKLSNLKDKLDKFVSFNQEFNTDISKLEEKYKTSVNLIKNTYNNFENKNSLENIKNVILSLFRK